MDNHWAAEHLQVIRTLMERSALYRRALAPVMTTNGVLGTLAAAVGVAARLEAVRPFIGYWMAVAVVAVAVGLVQVRRQALKEAEPFWSPPTRRVAQALLPPLFCGLALGLTLLAGDGGEAACLRWLPLVWIALYGCALHAAGFFMPRGMKIFGWGLVAGSSAFGALSLSLPLEPALYGHAVMGLFFGLAHLAYGIYLYFTEPRRNDT